VLRRVTCSRRSRFAADAVHDADIIREQASDLQLRSATATCTRGRVAGRSTAIVLMLARIEFLAVLTATIASVFVKEERGVETAAIIDGLTRIEADIAAAGDLRLNLLRNRSELVAQVERELRLSTHRLEMAHVSVSEQRAQQRVCAHAASERVRERL
jgi:hypothetical protein